MNYNSSFKSNYPWLKKLQEKGNGKKNDIAITKVTVLGGSPLSGNTELSFTGYGEDGRLQPSNPVGMFNSTQGAVMKHEGEAQIRFPDGETAIIPANQLNQDMLRKIEQKSGMMGAQRGGLFQRDITTTPTTGGSRDVMMGGVNPVSGGNQTQTGTLPSGLGLRNTVPKQTPLEMRRRDITPPVVTPPNLNVNTPTIENQTLPVNPVIENQTLPVKPVIENQTIPVNPVIEDVVPPTVPSGSTLNLEGTIQNPEETTPQPQLSASYQEALNRMKKYAEGQDPYAQKIREEERMRLAGEEVAAKGALEQRMSQLGLTGREALTEQALLQREYGNQETELISALRKGEADRAFTAAQQLPGEILAKMEILSIS